MAVILWGKMTCVVIECAGQICKALKDLVCCGKRKNQLDNVDCSI